MSQSLNLDLLYPFMSHVYNKAIYEHTENPSLTGEEFSKKCFSDISKGEKIKEKKTVNKKITSKWLTTEEYCHLIDSGDTSICGYVQTKAPNKGKVCCAEATSIDATDFTLNRCVKCSVLKSKKKLDFDIKDRTNVNVPGFNTVLSPKTSYFKDTNKTEFLDKKSKSFSGIVNLNVSDNYLFCINENFHGLVLNTKTNECIGKIINDNGDNLKVDKFDKLNEDWLDYLIELNNSEQEFLEEKNIIYNFRN